MSPNQIVDNRAESMAEVIIAFTVFSIVATGVAVLLHTQQQGSTRIKTRTEAYTLAREGTELIKNLLDTNALRFPGDPENCWDTIDETSVQNCVASTKLVDGGIYLVDEETEDNSRWGAVNVTQVFPATDTLLYEHTVGGSTIYNHQSTGGTATKFSRTVTIEKSQTFASSPSDDTLVATSTVTWEMFNQTMSAYFSLTFYNALLE